MTRKPWARATSAASHSPASFVAVGVDGHGRRVFGHDPVGVAVDGGGAGKDEVAHTRGDHRLQHGGEGADVLPVVPERSGDRFADLLAGCQMDDRLDALVGDEPREHVGRAGFGEVEFVGGHPVDAVAQAVREVVDDDGGVAAVGEHTADVRADVAGAPGDEYAHPASLGGHWEGVGDVEVVLALRQVEHEGDHLTHGRVEFVEVGAEGVRIGQVANLRDELPGVAFHVDDPRRHRSHPFPSTRSMSSERAASLGGARQQRRRAATLELSTAVPPSRLTSSTPVDSMWVSTARGTQFGGTM